MIPLVDLKKQYRQIKDEIQAAINAVLESSAFINGKFVEVFEENFAAKTGAKYCVGSSSGTTALHLALVALGVGKNDEVITVPNTFIATAEVISQAGAKIRFVDIHPQTYNIDVEKIEQAITKQTKAIIPVHLYGQPCDIDPILSLAKKYNLKVVFDAAQAHMATYKGEPLGKFGDAVCYSFYPGKNLGAYGDAGAVTVNDASLALKMRMLSNHGRLDKYEHDVEGYNYRLDALQAAVLDVKLKYLSEWTKRRQEIAHRYSGAFQKAHLVIPYVLDQAEHVYHLYVVRLKKRDAIQDQLKKQGIATGVHYPIALHLQKAYAYLGHKSGDFPVAESYSKEILSLPMFAELEEEEITKVINTLKELLAAVPQPEVQNV